METIWRKEGDSNRGTITDRISNLEESLKLKNAKDITDKSKKKFEWKGKFKSIFKRDPKKIQDKLVVICFNAKKEIEEPVILPIISGGIIVYKDKGFAFDPSCLYTIRSGNKIHKVLVIEEDDRLPIGHKYKQLKSLEYDELKKQGRYTFNDSILLKMLWNAQIEKKPKMNINGKMIFWFVLLAIVAIMIFMFIKK